MNYVDRRNKINGIEEKIAKELHKILTHFGDAYELIPNDSSDETANELKDLFTNTERAIKAAFATQLEE